MKITSEPLPRGKKVQIIVCEPWDLVTEMGSPRRAGTILDATQHVLLIELKNPIVSAGTEYRFFLAYARLAGDLFTQEKRTVFCNMESVIEGDVEKGIPEPPPDWHGRLGLMGDVSWED